MYYGYEGYYSYGYPPPVYAYPPAPVGYGYPGYGYSGYGLDWLPFFALLALL